MDMTRTISDDDEVNVGYLHVPEAVAKMTFSLNINVVCWIALRRKDKANI